MNYSLLIIIFNFKFIMFQIEKDSILLFLSCDKIQSVSEQLHSVSINCVFAYFSIWTFETFLQIVDFYSPDSSFFLGVPN